MPPRFVAREKKGALKRRSHIPHTWDMTWIVECFASRDSAQAAENFFEASGETDAAQDQGEDGFGVQPVIEEIA